MAETMVVKMTRTTNDDVVYIGRTLAGRTDQVFYNPHKLRDDTNEQRARLLVEYFTWLQSPDRRARGASPDPSR